jgi:hypothetical protein
MPKNPEPLDLFELDRDHNIIGGAPGDQGGSLHACGAWIAESDDDESNPVDVAQIGINEGTNYSAAYLGPRDARALAAWLTAWADAHEGK